MEVKSKMVKTKPTYVWSAEATLEMQNLNLAVTYDEMKRGGRTVRVFKPHDWMGNDGDVLLDPGHRLKGWFKQQAKTIRPSLADCLQYGLKCKTLPKTGLMAVAKLSDIQSNDNFAEKDKTEYYLSPELEKVGYPFKEVFSFKDKGTTRSVFTFHYVIDKPITVKVQILSFARNFRPEGAEEMLKKLGSIMGIGDGYAQGYGCFELKNFKSNIEELNI
jgi:hypothetical protein